MKIVIKTIPHDQQRTCQKCGEVKPLDDFYRHPHGQAGRLARCKKCVEAYERERHRRPGVRKRHLAVQARYNRKVRAAVLAAYGGKCACCGEARYEFLHIDHINGGGRKHRAEVGGKLAEVLKREGYPIGYRILCANCNLAYGIYGYCPHDEERQQCA